MIVKEQLEELYIKQNKLRREIAEELNVPISQVDFYLNRYHIKKIVEKLEKVCPICGKHFFVLPMFKEQKYCCRTCSRIGTRKVERKICPNCGKEFPAYYRKSIYCSKKCAKEHKIKLNDEIHINICQECGKEYEYFNNMPNWFKEGQHESNKYHGIDSSKYCCYDCGVRHRQKVSRQTCLEKYGKEFTGQTENNLRKSYKTKLERYGNPHFINPKKVATSLKKKTELEKLEIKNKICKTKLERYGNPFYNGDKHYTEKERQIRNQKAFETMKKNNTFYGKGLINNRKCSLDEQKIYETLIQKFPNTKYDEYVKQYGRYDFYIPELDLYIEYQGFWTHGKNNNEIYGPYNQEDEKHQKLLELWKEKSKKHKLYLNAIYVWTKNDPKKRKIANELKMKIKEFWNIEEFERWFNSLE